MNRIRFALPAAAAAAVSAALLAGCAPSGDFHPEIGTVPPPPESAASEAEPTFAALNQTVDVGGPRVTPLEVLEDSRCPMNARCVWAGQVRLRIRVTLGSGANEMEITSGKPLQVADGALELVAIQPDRMAGGDNGGQVAPADYRFGFSFAGGL